MNKYPTDEELELFISQLEEQELYAPRHMKEQILSQVFPEQTTETAPEFGRGGKSTRLLAYRLKIIAGMAAALFVLMVWPMQERTPKEWDTGREEQQNFREQEMEREASLNINGMLNERTRKLNQKMNSWLDRIEDLERFNLFGKKGGYSNEN